MVENVTVELTDDGPRVVPDEPVDMFGHGTACGAIILGLAPDVELVSIRVLGADPHVDRAVQARVALVQTRLNARVARAQLESIIGRDLTP